MSCLISPSVGHQHAEFTFFSARTCRTSLDGEKLPEETVRLSAKIFVVGFKNIIETMRSICGQRLSSQMKGTVGSQGSIPEEGGRLRTAYALHETVIVLKENAGESNVIPPYVHFGP
ncbi:hypothetical protein K488DRAFT_57480 [Vararia minispora EC-137]|uniref:Uncharacterized protein n=1 Tax=Vararia minispora EC-137 TaxID=1314806 RepID=A0ACB8QB92_9AGAM|nr:hypothetical protein K488DRAFT_57480 [Vararia minispora EC-137]